jgi:gluconolactonase
MVDVLDTRFAAVAAASGPLECLCTGAVWSEGSVWLRETGELLWSDIPNDPMLCWHPVDGLHVWRQPIAGS